MTVCTAAATRFLDSGRLALVGASDDRANFGRTVLGALRASGRDVVAVNPSTTMVLDEPSYPSIADVPGPVAGAIVMVGADRSADVVAACAEAGIPRVWLFRGLGGSGAVSDEALRLCDEHGLEVVAGACPLMFLEPVGWFHRVHRAARRAKGAVDRCDGDELAPTG